MDNRRVLANRMSALKDCEPWEMWSWGDFIESLGIDRSSNWEDTVDRVCRLIGGDPEREKAADWVEGNGDEVSGKLDAYDAIDDERGYLMELRAEVAARLGVDMACMLPSLAHARILGELYKLTDALERYARMLNRIDSLLAGDEQECFAADTPPDDAWDLFGAMLGELGKRLMPLGMEWPRFEDGEKVCFGDRFELPSGSVGNVVKITLRKCEPAILYDGIGRNAVEAKRPKPKVLAADGLPIEVGQTLWSTRSETFWVVSAIDKNGEPHGYMADSQTKSACFLSADLLTHIPPMHAKDGLPIKVGEIVYGGDGEAWEVTGIQNGPWNIVGKNGDKQREMKPKWLTHEVPTVCGKDGLPILPGQKVITGAGFHMVIESVHYDRCPYGHIAKWVKYKNFGWDLAESVSHAKPKDTSKRIAEDEKKHKWNYWGCLDSNCNECPSKIDGKNPRERYGVDNCGKAKTIDLYERRRKIAESGE